jgi:hypothetical protein
MSFASRHADESTNASARQSIRAGSKIRSILDQSAWVGDTDLIWLLYNELVEADIATKARHVRIEPSQTHRSLDVIRGESSQAHDSTTPHGCPARPDAC